MTASAGSRRPTALIRQGAKAAVLPLGLARPRRKGDLLILAYHRVGTGASEIDMPPVTFERQLAYLADQEGDSLRTLDEALPREDGSVVVTFDDGYRDFSDSVLPALVRHRIPALLYLATGLVVDGVEARTSAPDALTWPMLREAVASGLVAIGSHTHDHVNLARATSGEAASEMQRSKDLIEENLQVECRHFAYPWGVASPAADREARRLFHTAALDGWRTNRPGRMDVHRLGRTPILRSDGMVFFRAKRLGLLDSEALLYRALGRGPWGKM